MPTYHYGSSSYGASSRRRRRRPSGGRRVFLVIFLILLAGAIGFGVYKGIGFVRAWVREVMEDDPPSTKAEAEQPETGSAESKTAETAGPDYSLLIEEADRQAAQYDYDRAIELLKQVEGYEQNAQLSKAVSRLTAARSELSKVDITKIAQLSVRSLIADPAAAFSSRSKDTLAANCITVSEFKAVLEQLYKNGYVLVSLHDMAGSDENGAFAAGAIRLPQGKKALVLSVEEVASLETNTGLGFAGRLVLDEEGNPKNEISRKDQTLGELDVVPILESFIKKHPDFSYKGTRGIIALTAYDGILGYRTAPKYGDPSHADYKPTYAGIDTEAERAEAAKLAARLKELGWEFASRSWGRINMANAGLERIEEDTARWKAQTESLIGPTDILFFDSGGDIGSWRGYAEDNEKFAYLSSEGFHYFCGVDLTTIPWVQFSASAAYLRQGRVTVNGTSLKQYSSRLAPFFDAEAVLDQARPQ